MKQDRRFATRLTSRWGVGLALFAMVAVVGGFVAGGLSARAGAEPRPPAQTSSPTVRDGESGSPPARISETPPPPQLKIRVNARGQTYGSDMAAKSMAEVPDLIAAFSDSGRRGYVRKTDIYDVPEPESPDKALEFMCQQMANPPKYSVFKSDGVTRIGTLTVGSNGYTVEDGKKVTLEDKC